MAFQKSTSIKERAAAQRLTDSEVVARVLSGECALFELLMRRYNQRLYRVARGILRNNQEAEDALQNGYIRAFQSLAQFRGPNGFGAWIARIVSNEALMTLRKKRISLVPLDEDREASSGAINGLPGAGIEHHTPERAMRESEITRLLEAAIDTLPDAYRTTFILREVEQLSVAETADVLQICPATVKTRVHRARQLLQGAISRDLEDVLGASFGFAGRRCNRMVQKVFDQLEIAL